MGRICRYQDCNTRAVFNIPTEQYPMYCKEHKEDGMLNVIKKTCHADGCQKQPRFNLRGQKKGKFCSGHKEEGMVDMFSKTCKEDGCGIAYAIYNYITERKGIYCKTHMKAGMVDIKNKQCEEEGCHKQPRFNYETEARGRFCMEHKHEDMVNVVSKEKCMVEKCSKRPTYNFEGSKNGLYCKVHKQDAMLDVVSRQCREHGCQKQPTFNYSQHTVGDYCVDHKREGMVNVTGKRCKNEGCDTIPYYFSKCRGYCLYCFVHLFPDEPATYNFKTKERHVTDYIESQFPDWTFAKDRRIQDGCSKRRPDLMVDFGAYVLIVEIDEEQHFHYESICENKRTMELSQDIGHRPIVFIRFNPDKYIDSYGEVVRSCWRINKFGVQSIEKEKISEWDMRLEVLRDTIQTVATRQNEKLVDTIHLFYDGFREMLL